MKLYYFETPNPRKAVTVAQYLEAPVEYIRVDLLKDEQKDPEFIAINPNGKVPTLTDGDKVVWESNAIICYLARKEASDLWPRDELQIDIVQWLSWDSAHFSRHANSLMWENVIKPAFGMGDPDPATIEEATGFFRQFAAVLDQHLQHHKYVVGNTLSVADFAVSSTLPLKDIAKLPLDGFDAIERWRQMMNDIPAWRDPFPEHPATAASPLVP